jgi:hypothetical protein
MSRAIALVRCGCPIARKYSRASFHAASTASLPPLVKKTRSIPPGATDASFAASSIAAGCAVPQFVLKASVVSCAAAAAAISSP